MAEGPRGLRVFRAALTVGSFTMLSRLTGFGRDVLIASALGAGPAADAFFVSFKLANAFRRMFAEGAFGAGFVPLFTRTLQAEGEAPARRFAAQATGLMLGVLLPVVALAELLMPWLVRAIATGFDASGERFGLAVELSRITFPYLALISLAALLAAVLNARGRFAAAAFAPVLLNLTLIAALLLAAATRLQAVQALAWGVALAGVVQLGWLAAAAGRAGFGLRVEAPRLDARMRRLAALVGPGIGAAGLTQITMLMNSWFASHLPPGAIAHLFYADRLVQLPLGLVGAALATALLPALSQAGQGAGEREAARATLRQAVAGAALLSLPAAAGLGLLAGPIIRVLFERGAFDATASAATAATLAAMAVGLPAAVLARVLSPAYFAQEDTGTPVRIVGLALLVNLLLILLLIGPLREAGIALAGSLAGWLNAGLLALGLWRRGELVLAPTLRRSLLANLAATLAMAGCVLLLLELTRGLHQALALAAVILGGGLVFLAVAAGLGALAGFDLKRLRRRVEA